MNLTGRCSKMSRLKWILEWELFRAPRSHTALELPGSDTGSVNVLASVQDRRSTFGSLVLSICLKKEITKAS